MSERTTALSEAERAAAGPGRFVVSEEPGPRRSPLGRVGAALALLGIIVGVPALLFWLSGPPPIPTRLPTRDDFTQNLGIEQLLTVLVAVVWIAWLQFVICVAVELLSAIGDRGVPTPVPLSGPSQRLARALVGALLLTSVVGGTVGSVVSAVASVGPRADVAVSATVNPAAPARAGPTAGPDTGKASVPSAGPTASGGATAATAQGSAPQAGPAAPTMKVYTVKWPVGHHHDTLWEIAERHLGDGRRYKEIVDLNKGRVQSDGRSLQQAHWIYSGWELVMPADAVGVDVVPATVPGAPVAAPEAPTLPTSVPVDAPVVSAPHVQHRDLDALEAARPGGDRDTVHYGAEAGSVVAEAPNALVAGLAAGGVLAGCVLLALQRVRRRSRGGADVLGEALEAEVGLRAGADLTRTRLVDNALRSLATRCAATGVAAPMVYAARVDDDQVSLLITPARSDAPDPWTVQDDGRRWTVDRNHLGRGASGGPAPYPALVSLGRDEDGTDLFVDLEAMDGPVQLTGDPLVAGQVASAIALQLATSPWSDEVHVFAVGIPDTLAVPAGGALEVVDDVEAVVQRLEARAASGRADVLTGRLQRGAQSAPEYAVFATGVDSASGMRLATVLAGGRHPVGVVGVGEIPGAQWQLTVDEAGTLTIPLLGISVTAHRLTDRTAQAVAELFEAATTPAAPVREGLAAVPAAAGPTDDGAFAIAPARLGILGPVTVRAEGPLDPSRTALAEEVVAYLALHPGGVHPTVLAAAVWPRGVTEPVARASVERVRDWLGVDDDGTARLRTDATGRYVLAPSVACDWEAFCALVDRARVAPTPAGEADLLRRALRLVRGPAFDQHVEGRYSWLARTGVERTIADSVVQVAHRLVELGRSGDDPDGAAAAAEAGLRLAKDSQLLWRDVLELEFERGGAAAVRRSAAELSRTVTAGGGVLEPETEALVDHLVGGTGPVVGARA